MADSARIGHDDAFARGCGVAFAAGGDLESATAAVPDAHVRCLTPVGGDPRDPPARHLPDEADAKLRPVSEIGGMNHVNDRHDVLARSTRDEERDDPADERQADEPKEWEQERVALEG